MVEEARQGRDVATLEVVMEAAGPLNTWPAGRFGGGHWAGASLGNYAEPPTHGYGS